MTEIGKKSAAVHNAWPRKGCRQGKHHVSSSAVLSWLILFLAGWLLGPTLVLARLAIYPSARAAEHRAAGGSQYARARKRSRPKPRAPAFQRPPASPYVWRLRRSAVRRAAPSQSALHGCGCPVRVKGDTRVALQHSASWMAANHEPA